MYYICTTGDDSVESAYFVFEKSNFTPGTLFVSSIVMKTLFCLTQCLKMITK